MVHLFILQLITPLEPFNTSKQTQYDDIKPISSFDFDSHSRQRSDYPTVSIGFNSSRDVTTETVSLHCSVQPRTNRNENDKDV